MPTTASAAEIRADFDAMARLMPERLGPHEAWLLRQLPRRRGTALEIGCGVGTVAQRLARSFDRLDAIDFSPAMIAEAKRRVPLVTPSVSEGPGGAGGAPRQPFRGDRASSVQFVCTDAFDWLRDRADAYDCIVAITMLHHVDLAAALRAMARSLRPGGRLLALDVMHRRRQPIDAIALALSFRFLSWKLRRAFWRHGRNETYLTIGEARGIARDVLPGAQVRAHLMWRYSIVWDKP